jgi:hypothetical protein
MTIAQMLREIEVMTGITREVSAGVHGVPSTQVSEIEAVAVDLGWKVDHDDDSKWIHIIPPVDHPTKLFSVTLFLAQES